LSDFDLYVLCICNLLVLSISSIIYIEMVLFIGVASKLHIQQLDISLKLKFKKSLKSIGTLERERGRVKFLFRVSLLFLTFFIFNSIEKSH
jgi:hypothetical protein